MNATCFVLVILSVSLLLAVRVIVGLFSKRDSEFIEVPVMTHFSCDELTAFSVRLAEGGVKVTDDYSKEDLLLYSATRTLCLSDIGEDLLTVKVAEGFGRNYLQVFGYLDDSDQVEGAVAQHHASRPDAMAAYRHQGIEPHWVDEAYVNYFSDETQEKHYNRTALLVQSVHEFSTRPILVFYVSDSKFNNDAKREKLTAEEKDVSVYVDTTGRHTYVPSAANWVPLLDPDVFPRLVVFQISSMDYAGVSNRVGFNVNKLRSMLLSRCRVCVEVDSDTIIYRTADEMFERTAALALINSALAAAPISPAHWMTRDPDSDDYRDEEGWVFRNYNGTRTMSWIHAHPTWTYKALPFISALFTGMVLESPNIDKVLLRSDLSSDERALNVYYWSSGFSAQWCMFDLFPAAFKYAVTEDLDGMRSCCELSDSKWHPNGQPLAFHTVHGLQNDDDAREMLRLFRLHKHIPKVYWNGKFYYNLDDVPTDSRRCLL